VLGTVQGLSLSPEVDQQHLKACTNRAAYFELSRLGKKKRKPCICNHILKGLGGWCLFVCFFRKNNDFHKHLQQSDFFKGGEVHAFKM
jgi:hypothetical protein